MSENDVLAERSLMSDFWNFRKKYHTGKDSDDYWLSLIRDADNLSRKYSSLYADMLICVCVTDIENRFYQSRGEMIDSGEKLAYAMRLFDILRSRYSD